MMSSKEDTLQIGYGKVDIEEGLLEVNHVDTESGNRIKTTIGAQNGYYSHYYTTAPNGNYFGQKVTVDNEIVSTSDLYGQSNKKVAYAENTLENGSYINAGSDANDIKSTGIFMIAEGDATNYPTRPNGAMIVFAQSLGNSIIQMYVHFDGSTWVRQSWYGTWQPWRQMT